MGLLFGGDTKTVCADKTGGTRARKTGDGGTGDNASEGENKHRSERKPDRGEREKRSMCWVESVLRVSVHRCRPLRWGVSHVYTWKYRYLGMIRCARQEGRLCGGVKRTQGLGGAGAENRR